MHLQPGERTIRYASEYVSAGRFAMTTIRAAFALLTLCSLIALGARPSVAETYRPWCVQYQNSRGGSTSCAFTSFEQCMMTAGPGTGGVCVQNPWYLWYDGRGRRGKVGG